MAIVFNDDSKNYGRVESAATFNGAAVNLGEITGLAKFYEHAVCAVPWPAQTPPNYTQGVTGGAEFYDYSENTGMIVSTTYYKGYSRHSGINAGYVYFQDNSCTTNVGGFYYPPYPDPPPVC